jgi:hypothetical protein
MRVGLYVYGLAAIATGVIDLVWGGFETAHEPIQAFGDRVPGQQIFAYIIAVLLVAGGAAILGRRTARFGAVLLGIAYLIFAVFWLPRFYTAPRILGFALPVYIGVLGGVCQQLIIVAAAAIVYASASTNGFSASHRASFVPRWIFGLSSVDFGLAHLTAIQADTPYVPHWIPFGQAFWVAFTGTAFVLAGIAVLTGILDVLAARLLALMLLVFSALTLAPLVFANPHDQVAWGANAYNLAAVGSAWILASWLAHRQRPFANLPSVSAS